MTERPKYTDEPVRRYAALTAAEHLQKHMPDLFDGTTLERVEADLYKAFRSAHEDGYQICKRLEDLGWQPDVELVETMNYGWLRDARTKAIKDWVKAWNITAPLAVGQRVTFLSTFERKPTDGEIVAHQPEEATSTIFVESAGHVRTGLGTQGEIIEWERLTASD
jgi:hypothetical protein